MALDLAAIKARCDLATEEPWEWESYSDSYETVVMQLTGVLTPDGGESRYRGIGVSAADAEFIAQARTDVPALVAEAERLRAELAWVRIVIRFHQQSGCGLDLARIGESMGGDRPTSLPVAMSGRHWLVEHATRGGHVHITIRCGPQPHSRAKLGDLVATAAEWDNDLAPVLRHLPNVTFEAAP